MTQKPQDQLDAEVARARANLATARSQLLWIPGVRYVSVGIKETGGMATQEVVFHVYVDRKKPLAELAPADRIPATAAGIGTDVISLHSEPHDILVGGMDVTGSLWGLHTGTMGVIGLATADNTHAPVNTPLLLTNHHVAGDIGGAVGRSCLCDSWCCKCCDIGLLVDAAQTNLVDGAIATLNAGVHFSHEILGIGAIRGPGVATMNMPIVKYGATSGFTKGSVTAIDAPSDRSDGVHFDNQIRVAATLPYKQMSIPGDSGSVYVEEATNRVVGLNHAGADGIGIGNHIADVTDKLKINFPVIGTAGAIPLAAMPVLQDLEAIEQVLALRRDLEGTEFGRQWFDLVRAHSAEVRHLVNHHRTAKVAWQRCQGPGFLAHFLTSARDRMHRVPREVAGMRLENAVISMAATFRQCGSPALADAVAQHYVDVLECAQGAESAAKALENVKRMAGGRRLSAVPESESRGQ